MITAMATATAAAVTAANSATGNGVGAGGGMDPSLAANAAAMQALMATNPQLAAALRAQAAQAAAAQGGVPAGMPYPYAGVPDASSSDPTSYGGESDDPAAAKAGGGMTLRQPHATVVPIGPAPGGAQDLQSGYMDGPPPPGYAGYPAPAFTYPGLVPPAAAA